MHAAIGLVPSGALIVLMQVYSRVFLVCGSLLLTQGATTSPGLPLCILAWSITEIIRYGYYTLNLVNMAPQTLLVLRFVLLNINSGKFLVAFWCLSFKFDYIVRFCLQIFNILTSLSDWHHWRTSLHVLLTWWNFREAIAYILHAQCMECRLQLLLLPNFLYAVVHSTFPCSVWAYACSKKKDAW